MKKILFVIPGFGHGGTNRSLLNLLRVNADAGWDVHVFSMDPHGPYKEKFGEFSVLSESMPLSALFSFAENTKNDGVFKKCVKLFWKAVYKLFFRNDRRKLFNLAAKAISRDAYDIVVAGQEGMATEFVSCISAGQRIAWIRCDYSSYLNIAKKSDETCIYQKFDDVICVSKYTAQVFASHYPQMAERVHAIHEPMDHEGIVSSSRQTLADENYKTDLFTFISVGRMDVVKRFGHIPEIARSMVDRGCVFRWYILGGGGTETEVVKKNIEKFAVEEQVILLGERSNPYPYIAASDVLVCPSITEACPNVVNEAKILHIPVVAADFPTASEYIENGVNGLIVPIDEMAMSLSKFCLEQAYYHQMKTGIAHFMYENDQIISAVNALLLGEER